MKKIPLLLLLFFALGKLDAQTAVLKKGMLIHKSIKFKKGIYLLNGEDSMDKAVLTIRGNDVVVDFNGAILKGSNNKKFPDEFYGLAINIIGGKNITIRNLTAKGYKIALLAKEVQDLTIENCDFSYNYRQHLNSTSEKEDLSDWMSYHHNEKDEWLRYGAAMYLRGCKGTMISQCAVTGGQNALMMMECSDATIYNNDFSFNSGIGLGMYRCSGNKVLYNRINFNVRGYSDGVYSRGQDSAGILVYEQSNDNLFYKNSATHSGDGFFLWAGQTTMDAGTGGCNNNLVMANDFSYAPANGVETTFSRNRIIQNRVFDCDYGIWGGYSFNTEISGNQFRFNHTAIAIEHGQDNLIHHNLFYGDKKGISLWANSQESADWGYARNRDTKSRGYVLVGNSFNRNELAVEVKNTDSVRYFGNRVSYCDEEIKTDSTVSNFDSTNDNELAIQISEPVQPNIPEIKNPLDPFKGLGKLAGRKNIMITSWGPYDFRYPIIWRTNPADTSGQLQFDLLGPKGKWKIVSVKGIQELSRTSDSFPGRLSAKKIAGDRTDIEIIARYEGRSYKDMFGNQVPAGASEFRYQEFFQPVLFSVSWYAFDSSSNPLTTNYEERVKTQRPFKIENTDRLDYAWWGGIKVNDHQYKQFLTIADGTADFSEGDYELGVTWDDAVRVYVDGKMILDEWNPSKYTFDESPHKKIYVHLAGRHQLRVEHVELGGFATLNLKIKKKDS